MPAAPLVDAHVHIADSAFADDRDDVIARALSSGVGCLVCNGTSPDDWPAVNDLARSCPQLVPCFGLHPWYVSQAHPTWLAQLERHLLSLPSAVGEIGLDRWLEPRDEPAQERAFRDQLDLARRLHRPAMIHCLRAWGWLMEVLNDSPPLPCGMLIHAYGGSADLIKPLADRGAYFSFSGSIFEPKREKAREALRQVPPDRLLLETDAPDMVPPEPFRPFAQRGPDGRLRNEPANLPAIFRGVARLLDRPEDELAETLFANARRFLGSLLPNV